MITRFNTPGKGMLIGAGVTWLIFGVFGLFGAWGLSQLPAVLMGFASPFIFGMSWDAVVIIMYVASLFYLTSGIFALIWSGNPNRAGELKADGIILLCWCILELILFTPHIGFSIFST